MIVSDFAERIGAWIRQAPDVTAGDDVRVVSAYLLAGTALIEALPAKPLRNAEETAWADEIHRACRAVRKAFVDGHATRIYAAARTADVKQPLSELAFAVAALVPGLVPSRAQLARERDLTLLEREGWEVDQGIFFHGILRSPAGEQFLADARRPTQRALDLLGTFRATGSLLLGPVRIERNGAALHVTLQNGASLNAEDATFVAAMETAVDLALLDDAVRVGVVRGGVMTHPRHEGRRVFCAGINLKHLHRGQIPFADFLVGREVGFLSKIARGLVTERGTIEKPWMAAVDGFAIGGGAQMLLVMDRVIAAAGSYFSLPAAREGIVPGVANLRLGRLLGARGARQVILADRRIDASEADAALLFDEVVPEDKMESAIADGVAQLQNEAVVANRHMLWVSEEPLDAFRGYMAEFALEQAKRLHARDVASKVWKPA